MMMSYKKYCVFFFLLFVLADLTVSNEAYVNHMLVSKLKTTGFNNCIALVGMSYSSRSTINICIHIIAKAAL